MLLSELTNPLPWTVCPWLQVHESLAYLWGSELPQLHNHIGHIGTVAHALPSCSNSCNNSYKVGKQQQQLIQSVLRIRSFVILDFESSYCMYKKSWPILYSTLLYKWVKISWDIYTSWRTYSWYSTTIITDYISLTSIQGSILFPFFPPIYSSISPLFLSTNSFSHF